MTVAERVDRAASWCEKFGKGIGMVVIPIVLGLGGWQLQKRVHEQTSAAKYIEIAVDVLSNIENPRSLRLWAVAILDKLSFVSFDAIDADLATQIVDGTATLRAGPLVNLLEGLPVTATGKIFTVRLGPREAILAYQHDSSHFLDACFSISGHWEGSSESVNLIELRNGPTDEDLALVTIQPRPSNPEKIFGDLPKTWLCLNLSDGDCVYVFNPSTEAEFVGVVRVNTRPGRQAQVGQAR